MNRTVIITALLLGACRTQVDAEGPTKSPQDSGEDYRATHDTWEPPLVDTGDADTGEPEDDTGVEQEQRPASLQARPDAVSGPSQVAWVGGGGSLDGWACDGLEVWASRDHECSSSLGLPADLPPDAWLCADVVEAGEWGCIATLDGVAQVVTVRGH